MVASKEDKFKEWIPARLSSAPAVTRIELQHIKADEVPAVVRTWEIAERDRETGQRMAAEVWAEADNHASAFGKVQLYSIVAFSGTRASAEFPIRIRGTATEAQLSESEPANQNGLLAQLMRHNEATTRTLVEAVGKVLERMEDVQDASLRAVMGENLALRTRVNEMEGKRLEVFTIVEELTSRKAERDLAALDSQKNHERKDRALRRVAQIIPKLLEGGSGGALALMSSAADDEEKPGEAKKEDTDLSTLGEVARSLTPEDAKGLKKALDPFKMGRLVGVLRTLSEGGDLPKVREAIKAFATSLSEGDIPAIRGVLGAERTGKIMGVLVKYLDEDTSEEKGVAS